MINTSLVEMVAMEGYVDLLEKTGHDVDIYTIDGVETKLVRQKNAKFVFNQSRKAGKEKSEDEFNSPEVDVTNIQDDLRYYFGFSFIPSVSSHYCQHERNVSSIDAAHSQEAGRKTYGTKFEVAFYDANNYVLPICFLHSVAIDYSET